MSKVSVVKCDVCGKEIPEGTVKAKLPLKARFTVSMGGSKVDGSVSFVFPPGMEDVHESCADKLLSSTFSRKVELVGPQSS